MMNKYPMKKYVVKDITNPKDTFNVYSYTVLGAYEKALLELKFEIEETDERKEDIG